MRIPNSTSSPISRGKQLAHILDHAVQIHHARLENLHSAERQELLRQSGGAVRRAIDLRDLSGHAVRGRQCVHQEFGMALDDHQKIIEIVRYTARKSPYGLHLLRLTKLLLQKMALADILRHDQAHSPPGIVELVRNQLNFKILSVFLAVLALRLGTEQPHHFLEGARRVMRFSLPAGCLTSSSR